MTRCVSRDTYIGSVIFFAVGAALFLATFIFWTVYLCKARRRRVKDAGRRPLPLAPPTMSMEVQASGAYLDLQESARYESVNVTRDVQQTENLRYIPRDAMHETFDGSRMPQTEAPKPPNYQTKTKSRDTDLETDRDSVKSETGSELEGKELKDNDKKWKTKQRKQTTAQIIKCKISSVPTN